MLLVALTIFLVGTIGGAFAWNIGSLIGFRALSGTGGAVFPLSFGIIRDEFPPEKVKVGIGLLSSVFGVGGGLGIVFSGLIVEYLSWRWLFIAGAIPVAAAILLVHRYVPESPIKTRARLDIPGARPARRRAHGAARCADRGRELGLDVPAVPGPDARERRPARDVDPHGAARRRADGRHADDEPAARVADEHDRAHRRVRDVRHLRARAAVRERARVRRLRLRRLADRGRASTSFPPR